jgi:hypothetical protein
MAHEVVSLFVDPEDSSLFTPGFIRAVDNVWVAIEIIDTYGQFDGYGIRPLEKICRIEAKGDYENKLYVLSKRNPQPVFEKFDLKTNEKNKSLLLNALQQAIDEKIVITLWNYAEEEITGYVNKIDQSKIFLFALKKYGYGGGELLIELGDIMMMDIGCNMEQSFKYLHELRLNNYGKLL